MSELNVDKLLLSGKLTIPSYTNTTRPANPDTGLIIFNTNSNALEVFNGDDWKAIGGGALFPFTTHTFTTGSTVGRFGPSISTLRTAYSTATWAQNADYFFEGRSQGYQVFKIPKTGTYEIEVAGSRGDNSSNPTSGRGRGAIVRARFVISAGTTLEMVVGQVPGDGSGTSSTSYCGGGGGSYVAFYGTNTPLIIAGGGTGIYSTSPPQAVRDGQTRTRPRWTFAGNNSAGSAVSYSPITEASTEPVASNGGHGYHGGGGGGFLTSGGVYPTRGIADSAQTGAGNQAQQYTHGAGFCGQDYTTYGGIGGTHYAIGGNATTSNAQGGFGGGGGGHSGNNSSGGGGGYTGGMGGQTSLGGNVLTGTGGGSFIATTNSVSSPATSDGQYDGSTTFSGSSITNINSFNDAAGYIKITLI